MSIDRIVLAVAGFMILLSLLLGLYVSPYWYWFLFVIIRLADRRPEGRQRWRPVKAIAKLPGRRASIG